MYYVSNTGREEYRSRREPAEIGRGGGGGECYGSKANQIFRSS